jgi:calcineurin-like phosphoesterase family protein
MIIYLILDKEVIIHHHHHLQVIKKIRYKIIR